MAGQRIAQPMKALRGDTIEIGDKLYQIEETGLKNIPYLLLTPRGARYELLRMRDRDGTYNPTNPLVCVDKSGRRIFGRTLFSEIDGFLIFGLKQLA